MRVNEIVYEQDENGEFELVDYKKRLDDRNEEIKGKLEEAYTILKKEKETCRALKSKEKMGGRFAIQLDRVLRSYGLITADEFINLDYQQIEDNYNAFLDLISHYNLAFEIVPNKQLFCAFMRINNRHYTQLEQHGDSDIRDLMSSINDSLISIGFMSTESGNADGTSTYNRMTLHGAGHGLIKENEKQAIDKFGELPTLNEIDQEFSAIFGSPRKPKQLKK
jgi:hypothetical protein